MLRDREEAGRLLALRLDAYRDDAHGLILALPRGGVAVGYELSVGLHLPLDVFLVRKLGAPGNPEYAVGAVTETGSLYLNHEAMSALSLSSSDLEQTIRVQQDEIIRQQALYRKEQPLPTLTDRTVLLVDDGVATGATFLASIQALRGLHVKRLVAAIPVGPSETLYKIGKSVDELVALQAPEPFFAVGNHYMDFRQVEDEEVLRYLAEANSALGEEN
ncbi:MAG: phosphoribosyltransferase [Nitrospirae bacterium]|nr:phosphoribosyltransferase [Nitrospirota bacterium]